MNGKHIELFLVDGESGGLVTAEVATWTGHLLKGPRSQLAALLSRDETKRNGVYLLLGEDPSALGGVQCYVGRTENFRDRLKHHDLNKDDWDRVVLISSKDHAFNEGHWGYLEARIVELAKKAKRASLPNIQIPRLRKLSEAQASDVEAFIRELQILLPVLGVDIIRGRKTKQPPSKAPVKESPTFTLESPKRGVRAQMEVIDGEITVLEGGKVVGEWVATGKAESTQKSYTAYRAQHEKLVNDGSIRVSNGQAVLTRDVQFNSPSTASAVLLGRSSNGRQEWKWKNGSYADWENRGVDVQ